MDPITRANFERYAAHVALQNGVASAFQQFNVTPAVEQRLEAAIREDSSFLRAINIVGVRDIKGEVVYGGTTGTIAGRTDTSAAGVRIPREVVSTNGSGYECKQTNFDTAIRYATLDAWSSQPNFMALMSAQIVSQIAEDRIMIGLNGLTAEATTNRVAAPLLQDVNKGWLQHYRSDNPERHMTEAEEGAGGIWVGGNNADYENIDALVYQSARNLIHPAHVDSGAIRVLVGRGTLDEKYFPIINSANVATEVNALDMVLSSKKVGGYPAVQLPFMPEGSIFIQPLNNLSIYYQRGARRRHMRDEPTKDRVENFESSNEAYVVENFERGCLIENVIFGDKPAI